MWDVLASCAIRGASDASIRDAVPNDLSRILDTAPIERIYATGAKARISLVVFAIGVLTYALLMEGTPIYELAAMAYQFPVIGAFWPLTLGLYWKRSTTLGCWLSIIAGSAVWIVLSFSGLGEEFPALLGGFLAAGLGQVIGSLLPLRANRECVRNWQENKDKYLYIAQ